MTDRSVRGEPPGNGAEERDQPIALRDLARQTASIYTEKFRKELNELLSDCGLGSAKSVADLPKAIADFLHGSAFPSEDDLLDLFRHLQPSSGFMPARAARLVTFYLDASIPPLQLSEIGLIHQLVRSADGRAAPLSGGEPSAETCDDVLALEFARLVGHEHAWRAIHHLYRAASGERPAQGSDEVGLQQVADYRERARKPPPLAVGWDAILYYRLAGDHGRRELQILRAPELKYLPADDEACASAFEFTSDAVEKLAEPGAAAAFDVRYRSDTEAFRHMAGRIVGLWAKFDRGRDDDDPDGCKLRLLAADTTGPELKLHFGRYSHFYYRTVNDSIIHASFDQRFLTRPRVRPFRVDDDAEWDAIAAAMVGWRDELMPDWLNFCFTRNQADEPFPRTGSMFTTHQSVEAWDGFAFIWQRAPGQDYQADALTFGYEEQAYADRTRPIGNQKDWPILKPSSRDLYKPPSASRPDETVDQTVARGLREELGVRGKHPDHMGRFPRDGGVPPRRRFNTTDSQENRDADAEILPYALAFEVNAANAIALSHVRLPYLTGTLGDLWLERAAADGDEQEEGRDLELRRCFTVPLTFHHVLPWVLRDSTCRAGSSTPTIPGVEDVRAIFGGVPNPGADPPVHESSAARAFIALAHTYGWDRTLLDAHYWARFWDQPRTRVADGGVRKTLRSALQANLDQASTVASDRKWPSDLQPDTAVTAVEAAHTWYWYEQLARLLELAGQSVRTLRSKIMECWTAEDASWLSRRWAYQTRDARVPIREIASDREARAFHQRLLFALLSVAPLDPQRHWLEIRLLFEAWRKARLAARELRLLDALREFAPSVSPFQHSIESTAARQLAESTGWHNLLRVHDTIILYYRLTSSRPGDQTLLPIDLAEVDTSDGSARPLDTAGLSDHLVQFLQQPVRDQRDGFYIQVNSFVHPLSDARVRRPRWQLRLVRRDRVDQIRSDFRSIPALGQELAPRSLDFIRHRSDLTAPPTTPSPVVGPQRLVVRVGAVDCYQPLRLYWPSGRGWSHDNVLSTDDENLLAALVAGSKGDVAGWIVGRGSEVFPNGASQREIEILAIGFDAASSDVVLYARCSIDPHGIPDEDFVTLGRDEVDAQLVETEAGRWQRADATLFLLHLAASPGYGWGYVRQLVQSVAPRSGESLHGT